MRARHFVACDYGAALAGPFDLVVSNPPYVASADIATLAPEVREHDPRHALDGGADGLAAYRAIAADAPRLLEPGGHLVVEIGAGQERAVGDLFAAERACNRRRHATTFPGIARALAATVALVTMRNSSATGPEDPKNRLECRKRPIRVSSRNRSQDW